MHAVVGDRLRVHGRTAGMSDQISTIIEVRGADGEPPYLVRHDDGSEGFVFPGSDAVVEHEASLAERTQPPLAPR